MGNNIIIASLTSGKKSHLDLILPSKHLFEFLTGILKMPIFPFKSNTGNIFYEHNMQMEKTDNFNVRQERSFFYRLFLHKIKET